MVPFRGNLPGLGENVSGALDPDFVRFARDMLDERVGRDQEQTLLERLQGLVEGSMGQGAEAWDSSGSAAQGAGDGGKLAGDCEEVGGEAQSSPMRVFIRCEESSLTWPSRKQPAQA